MPQHTCDDKSILVQVMDWCRQATSPTLTPDLYRHMSSKNVARPFVANTKQTNAGMTWSNILLIIRNKTTASMEHKLDCALTKDT